MPTENLKTGMTGKKPKTPKVSKKPKTGAVVAADQEAMARHIRRLHGNGPFTYQTFAKSKAHTAHVCP